MTLDSLWNYDLCDVVGNLPQDTIQEGPLNLRVNGTYSLDHNIKRSTFLARGLSKMPWRRPDGPARLAIPRPSSQHEARDRVALAIPHPACRHSSMQAVFTVAVRCDNSLPCRIQ